MHRTAAFSLILLLCACQGRALADTKAALRVIRDQCVGCHKPGKAKGGLLLTTAEKMMQGGDSGTPVKPGKAAESLLYQLCLAEGDPHMPPKKQLAAAELAALKAWIDAGAAWDAAVFDEPPAPRQVKLSTLPAAHQPVLAMALSPDEKLLAVARANTVLLVDLAQPARPVIGSLEGQMEPVPSLAWSRDGRWLVSGGFQKLSIWDAGTRQPARVISQGLVGNVSALVCDASGKAIFAADGESGGAGFIRQFDMTSGTLLATWKAHDDNVLSLRLSAKGDRLLSAGADKMARVWDAASLKLVAALEGHTNHITAAAFNQDATQVATAGADREVKVWDVASREQDAVLGDKKVAFAGIDWTPDGKTLAVITDKGACSLHTDLKKHEGTQRSEASKERKLPAAGEALTCVVITGDSKWVFAGSFEGNVHVWDAADGKLAGRLELSPAPAEKAAPAAK
ncbi:MAG: hypothetical protein LDL31_07915 [Prosthecobacter sp.]|nr:hypothetical protein [Prosthecobacter sp.]